ncbi:MAG: helix-turn-helix domain-containing protein [Lachnospiraceae bacterium]|nr:helix-turn-helix domain-containing protein [Lachnospiraceae bacterium]
MSNEVKGPLLTVEELQKELGIGKNTAYRLLKSGEIRSIRIGKVWKIPRKAVYEYIMSKANNPPHFTA